MEKEVLEKGIISLFDMFGNEIKFEKKEYALKFAKEHGYKFYLLFPNDIDDFFKYI